MALPGGEPKFLSTNCFTCLRASKRGIPVLVVKRAVFQIPVTVILDLMKAHLGFESSRFRAEDILCENCWTQLKEFNRFYLKVQRGNSIRNRSRSSADDDRNCFTCLFQTDDRTPILLGRASELGSKTVVSDLMVQHLGFKLDDFTAKHAICRFCLNQLVEFHSFHLQVEQNHCARNAESENDFQMDEEETETQGDHCVERHAVLDEDRSGLAERLLALDEFYSPQAPNEIQPSVAIGGSVSIDDDSEMADGEKQYEELRSLEESRVGGNVRYGNDGSNAYSVEEFPPFDESNLMDNDMDSYHMKREKGHNGEMEQPYKERDQNPEVNRSESKLTEELSASEKIIKKLLAHETGMRKHALTKAEGDAIIHTHLQYSCTICQEDCGTFMQLKQHNADVHGMKASVPCCGKRYYQKRYLLWHVLCVTGKQKEVRCDRCHQPFADVPGLERHMKSHHNKDKERFKCNRCGLSFALKTGYKKHMQSVLCKANNQRTESSIWSSKPGNSNGLSTTGMRDHDAVIRTHMSYTCSICQKNCASFSRLKKHMPEHGMKAGVLCCGREFLQKHLLYIHVLNLTEKLKPVYCRRCDRPFKHEISLKRHMKGHENKDNELYKCKLCDANFSFKAHFKDHLQNTHGDGDVCCEICHRDIPKTLLLKHMEGHKKTPDKLRWKCKICPRSFVNKLLYQKHISSHSDLKDREIGGETSANTDALIKPQYDKHSTSKSQDAENATTASGRSSTPAQEKKMSLNECIICDRTFPTDLTYHEHMKKVHDITVPLPSSSSPEATCKICNIAFSDQQGLVQHQTYWHSEDKK
ncbi:zinc finger protein 54-like [Armigeres subalbatus]|uniref:zinc finger protein 54-like n=1 Tax=Armigeres subalbatus TaxID=124917 RepID=UPI002ED45159